MSAPSIRAMNWSVAEMETIRETFFDELPDQRQLELKIEAAQLAIARLRETPYQHSLEQKLERPNQLMRDYAAAFGCG